MSRVAHFKASRRARIPSLSRRVFGLGFVTQPRNPMVLWSPLQTLWTLCCLRAKLLLTWPPRRPGSVLVLWNKPTKPYVQTPVVRCYPAPTPCSRLRLAFLPPCGPHLIPSTTSQVPQTKTTCLSTPWRPHRHRPFMLVLQLHHANQAATCNCNTRPRVSPYHVINHSSLKSDHPPVLGCS
jgi:hypothetical protein